MECLTTIKNVLIHTTWMILKNMLKAKETDTKENKLSFHLCEVLDRETIP